jgi:hypothetical protein
MTDPTLDTLTGAAAIAAFIGITERQAHHALLRGRLPAGKLGNVWISSRGKLREHLDGIIKLAAPKPKPTPASPKRKR